MKIEIEVSDKNESTSSPWWVILDPYRFFRANEKGINELASMVTGPFFSRSEAETELLSRRYDYGKHATVYCMSGCNSGQYRRALK